MAQVIPVGDPVNDAERETILHLRDKLPKDYLILHNLEIARDQQIFEIDLAVIAPHAVYLVDVKGTHGEIEVYNSKWYPKGRAPFASPLGKLRNHARALKGLLTSSDPANMALNEIHVEAVVILTAANAVLNDAAGKDAPSVIALGQCAKFFQDSSVVPSGRSINIRALHSKVLKALNGPTRRPSGPLRFGNWVVDERLSATEEVTEYRAYNDLAGARSGSVRLRVYRVDPYLPTKSRATQRKRIANAYQALSCVPGHACVVAVKDFFPTVEEDGYVLVLDDQPGTALALHMHKTELTLTFDQKLQVARDILTGLAHVNAFDVVHRNLSPNTVLLGLDGRSRLTGFEFARVASEATRSQSVAEFMLEEGERDYFAPEVLADPTRATGSSDVFSAGVLLYELFTGELPFQDATDMVDRGAMFGLLPTEHRSDLPEWFNSWCQQLCKFNVNERMGAEDALKALENSTSGGNVDDTVLSNEIDSRLIQIDFLNLPAGYELSKKIRVQERLGYGGFGVVYKVYDAWGDMTRAVKIILNDPTSTLERLKKEYQTLLRVPPHPRVVRVLDADVVPIAGHPFLVFEFIEGYDLSEFITAQALTAEEALEMAHQVAEGLVHLHANGVYHCDIKPSNLMWTSDGAKIIDFNVSARSSARDMEAGGTRRYLPPDVDLAANSDSAQLEDRDVFALGVTLYETVLGGRYPWNAKTPLPGTRPTDPRTVSGGVELSAELCEVMMRVIAPKRLERYGSAAQFLEALKSIPAARVPKREPVPVVRPPTEVNAAPSLPNTNAFVDHLITLYSQSNRSNSGTRGLTEQSAQTYVETALDKELMKAVLDAEFKLVVVTGNAGDGKTAFLQQLEAEAKRRNVTVQSGVNGYAFTLNGRRYQSNFDGSQDEGNRANDDVLLEFFAPYKDGAKSPERETRLIAINEGRLTDFLSTHRDFSKLAEVIEQGSLTGLPVDHVAVVNLNLRSIVSASSNLHPSIFEQQVQAMTRKGLWEECGTCDLRTKCYALHNAQTFQDEVTGPKVLERLKTLFTLVHLRGKLHLTLRDLRSALAFMFTSNRDCTAIHDLYSSTASDARRAVLEGFYFNSFMGGDLGTSDRLLKLLRLVDVGSVNDARLDRNLDHQAPNTNRALLRFEDRNEYDTHVLERLHQDLPKHAGVNNTLERFESHRQYVSAVRRRMFFERRDDGWREMLPYRSAAKILHLLSNNDPDGLSKAKSDVLEAINRGEGLLSTKRLKGKLALQVREVENGSVRSYRLFSAENFSLSTQDLAAQARFVEHMPTGLLLRYKDGDHVAELVLNLDVFEMLERLNDGYRPSVEELQDRYLGLTAFKNVLSSRPYQEILLNTRGDEFYRVQRFGNGRLRLERLEGEG